MTANPHTGKRMHRFCELEVDTGKHARRYCELNLAALLLAGYSAYYTALDFAAGASWAAFVAAPMYLAANALYQVCALSPAGCDALPDPQ